MLVRASEPVSLRRTLPEFLRVARNDTPLCKILIQLLQRADPAVLMSVARGNIE